MKISLYNTLTRKKEIFKPLDSNEVKVYVCGPTVYDYFHIGNARPFIVFDVLRRYLEYRGYQVKFVQNFTDIDDKMIKRANEEKITVKELGDRFIKEYFYDAEKLAIKKATIHPRASESIDSIIAIIQKLIDNGYAYNVNGDVYYRTKRFNEYGKLSHQPITELESGIRIQINENKEEAMDFALWKKQKPNEPAWDSPWGKGRPGWHIECSAMAKKYLGKTIDIHAGGQDLIFPHHENEIAQSEAANKAVFAKYWLHNGYINIDNKKMSKSLNNFFTVRDIAKEYDYEIIRFFMLSAHYRSPINFSQDLMEQAKSGLERIYTCLNNLNFIKENLINNDKQNDKINISDKLQEYRQEFINAMNDDLNTADAIALIFDLVRHINSDTVSKDNLSIKIINSYIDILEELSGVLGILQKDIKNEIDNEIEELIEKREKARKEKDWKLSDSIREELKLKGVILQDTANGVQVVFADKGVEKSDVK